MFMKRPIILLLLLALCTVLVAQESVKPSKTPPGGISPKDAPQFIVLGSDDNSMAEGMKWILDYIEGKKNPDGTDIRLSFYSNSKYFNSDLIAQTKRAYKDGHEVTNHTINHVYCLNPDTKKRMSIPDLTKEIKGCSDAIMDKVGVKKQDLKGFRTPFLAYTDTTFIVMKEQGFLYDCSINEGAQWDQKAGSYYWPYTLDHEAPGNDPQFSWWNKTYKTPIRKHPGLWELPCYMFAAPPDEECERLGIPKGFIKKLDETVGYETGGKVTGLDYNLWAASDAGGFQLNKKESLAILKYTLELMYAGNRTPMTVGMHSQYYSEGEKDKFPNIKQEKDRRAVLEEFIDFALDKNKFPKVRFASGADVIDWCRSAVSIKETNVAPHLSGIAVSNVQRKSFTLSLPSSDNYAIVIYGLNGQKIKTLSQKFMTKGQYTVDLADVSSKACVLSVKGSGKQFAQKLVLQ